MSWCGARGKVARAQKSPEVRRVAVVHRLRYSCWKWRRPWLDPVDPMRTSAPLLFFRLDLDGEIGGRERLLEACERFAQARLLEQADEARGLGLAAAQEVQADELERHGVGLRLRHLPRLAERRLDGLALVRVQLEGLGDHRLGPRRYR